MERVICCFIRPVIRSLSGFRAFVSDDEVTAVVDFLKKNNGVGTYDDDIAKSISGNGGSGATAIGGALQTIG